MKYRKEFYAKHPEEKINVKSPESLGEPTDSYLYLPEESLSLSLEYYNPEASEEKENDKEEVSEHLPRRYLRCPAAVTVFHLQKLIRAKYGLSEAHRVDIIYKEEPLCGNYTLMDISYIHHWRRVRITDNSLKILLINFCFISICLFNNFCNFIRDHKIIFNVKFISI